MNMSPDKKIVKTTITLRNDRKTVISKKLLSKNKEKLLDVKVVYPKKRKPI